MLVQAFHKHPDYDRQHNDIIGKETMLILLLLLSLDQKMLATLSSRTDDHFYVCIGFSCHPRLRNLPKVGDGYS